MLTSVGISASYGFPRRSFPTALVPGSPPALLCLCTLLVRESKGGKGHVLQYCPTQTLTPS